MIKIKKGVRIHGIRPELVLAFVIAERIYKSNAEDMMITSVIDGKHSRASIHYTGGAGDLRKPLVRARHVRNEIADAVGGDFDVILEDDHIHIEWQPKGEY